MPSRNNFRPIMMLGSALWAATLAVPSFAQTNAGAAAETSPSETVETPAVTNQAEWQAAVTRILQRYGAILSRELRPLELDGVFKPRISFYLSPDGTVSNVELIESSGDDLVDAAALKVPTAGAAFPPFTSDMASDKPKRLVAPFELRFQKPKPETPEPAPQAKP